MIEGPPRSQEMPELVRDGAEVAVEVVTDGHCITGNLRVPGIPRRLVDMLNGIEGTFMMLSDGKFEEIASSSPEPRTFRVAQFPVDAVLFAVPRAELPSHGSAFEVVKKVPVEATIHLAGIEMRGKIHVLPSGQQVQHSLVATRRFAPVTDVVVTSVHGRVWREPIVVVNMVRAFLHSDGD